MHVLVLGGNGFIGSHLVDILENNGDNIRVFDRVQEKYRGPKPGVEYLYGDMKKAVLSESLLKGIDTVFHLASTTIPGNSNINPAQDIMENVVTMIRLLENCVKQKIKKIVFISSGGAVYGSTAKFPISEEDSTNPESSYGIAKLMIEKYLQLFRNLYGLDYVILRPSNPYGERQNPYGTQGAISVFLGKIKNCEPIEIWGDGSSVRDYVYIEDLVSGIYKASHIASCSKIFNLGTGRGQSINEILEEIRRVTGKNFLVRYLPRRVFDPPKVILDISKARKELNWEPLVSLKSGIEKTWKFVKDTK